MTETEFESWLLRHFAAFPALLQWTEKKEIKAMWPNIRQSWLRVMGDVPFAEAERVTAELERGDLEPPKAWGEHARFVRQKCKSQAAKKVRTRRTVDGMPTFACRDCEDEGILTVFAPTAMADCLQGTLTREQWAAGEWMNPRLGVSVKCDCDAGKMIGQHLIAIDRKMMVPKRGGIQEMFDALETHIAKQKGLSE